MAIQRYSAKEALNRILRLFGDGVQPSTDVPETLPGIVYSENEVLSRLAELLGGSLDGETLELPISLDDAIYMALFPVATLSQNTVLSTSHRIVRAIQPITITLPTAVGFIWSYSITNLSEGNVTVYGNGNEKIGKDSTVIITEKYSTMTIYSDGEGWQYK